MTELEENENLKKFILAVRDYYKPKGKDDLMFRLVLEGKWSVLKHLLKDEEIF